MNIAERMKQLRHDKKITQQKLSDSTGLSRTTLANYERKGRQPNFETLTKIANAFDMTLIEFLQPCEQKKDENIFIKTYLKRYADDFKRSNRNLTLYKEPLSKNDRIEIKLYDLLKELDLENLFDEKNDIENLRKKIVDIVEFEAYKKINDID